MERESLLFSKRNVSIAAMALVLLLISTLIKNPFLTVISGKVLWNAEFFASLTKELSFALIIALVISIGIEHQTRKTDLQSADRLRKLIAEDVFKGVFANDLPRTYIDCVIVENLRVSIIRPYIRIYDRMSYAASEGPRSIQCSRRAAFTLKNVSDAIQVSSAQVYMPVDVSGSGEDTLMTSLKVSNKEKTVGEMLRMRNLNREKDRVEYSIPFSIRPGEEASFEMEMVFFKEASDSDVWSTHYPTLKLSYSVRFDVPVNRFGVAERSASNLIEIFKDDESGYGDWEIDGPILTHNSLTVWWDCTE